LVSFKYKEITDESGSVLALEYFIGRSYAEFQDVLFFRSALRIGEALMEFLTAMV